MRRVTRWILAAAIAVAFQGAAGLVWLLVANIAHRRHDDYLIVLAWCLAIAVAAFGLAVLMSLFASPREGHRG